jgi:hypothetical protein
MTLDVFIFVSSREPSRDEQEDSNLAVENLVGLSLLGWWNSNENETSDIEYSN